jgi:(5-formylfuran-3-yl)methyl phosphate synthase
MLDEIQEEKLDMRILVSPESTEEAISIMNCKVDILDVKNTKEGSLGAQYPWEIRKIVELARHRDFTISATLGDLPFKPGTAALASYGCASIGVSYIKAGLYGAVTYEQALEMMTAIYRSVRMVSDAITIVAAGYADWRRFGGLNPVDLVQAARNAKCGAVMLDTAIKDGRSLFDNMSAEEIQEFVNRGHQADLQVALAGSIQSSHAELLIKIGADIIGVRSAVCQNSNDRSSRISPEKTNNFVRLFREKD